MIIGSLAGLLQTVCVSCVAIHRKARQLHTNRSNTVVVHWEQQADSHKSCWTLKFY